MMRAVVFLAGVLGCIQFAPVAFAAQAHVWTAFLNGAAGYGYGAHGIWQFLEPSDPKGETGKMTAHPPVPWREAIRLPGSAQVRHARTLLTSLDGWNLQPRRDLLQVDGRPNRLPTATDLTPPQAASVGEETWIVYMPRGNEKCEIVLAGGLAGSRSARWFDPRRGEFSGPAVALNEGPRTLPPRPMPSGEDWVLVIQDAR